MKRYFLIQLLLAIAFTNDLSAQGIRVTGKIQVTIDRPFTDNFKVKSYDVSSGKIAIDEDLFGLGDEKGNGNLHTGGTGKGFGLNNMFSNFGGKGLFTLYQTSPFKGMEGRFQFIENINGVWHDVATLHINLPLLGSGEITLDYFPGYGANAVSFVNSALYTQYSKYEKKASGYGYALYDCLPNADFIDKGSVYQLHLSIDTRRWMNSAVNLPQTGSTTLYGTIKIDPSRILPINGMPFEDAIKKTFILHANAYSKAQWIKQDNNDSYIALQEPHYVGSVQFYDADIKSGSIKYRIDDVPNIVYGEKYFENKAEAKNALACCQLYSDDVGKYLYFDIANKANGKQKIYSWLSFDIPENATQYWQPASVNQPPVLAKNTIDVNNIRNGTPQLQLFASVNGVTAATSNLKNTTYDSEGNIKIETSSFTIEGFWTVANAQNGFVIDPNYNKFKNSISPIINPSAVNDLLATNSLQIQAANQSNLNNRKNKLITDKNINTKTLDKSKVIIKNQF